MTRDKTFLNAYALGFSLIELILFIVIIGIIASGILLTLPALLKNSPTANHQSTAVGLAQERMELILAQRYFNGFSTLSDPCTGSSPPANCTALAGYSVSTSVTPVTISGDSNYKQITVSVSGNGNAVLTTLVGNY